MLIFTAVRIRRALHIRTAALAIAIGLGALGALGAAAAPATTAFAQTETPTTLPKPKTSPKECIDKLEHGGAIRARGERELRHSHIERTHTPLEKRRRLLDPTARHAKRSPRPQRGSGSG